MRRQVKPVSKSMLKALDCRGARWRPKEQPSLISVVHDRNYVHSLKECLEVVDPGSKKALAEARRLFAK